MENNNKPQAPADIDASGQTEAPADFEAREELAALIAQMRAEPAANPGPDFSLQVMARISNVQTEMTEAVAATRQLRQRAASLMRYLTETPTVADIALCFLLAGFFYFLIGIILFIGLQTLQPLPSSAGWLLLQPQVAMLTAGVLGTIGLLLLLDGTVAMRLAQIGTSVFIAFSVFNGMWISITNAAAFTPIGLLCFTAAPVMLGLFLAASLQRYRRRSFAA